MLNLITYIGRVSLIIHHVYYIPDVKYEFLMNTAPYSIICTQSDAVMLRLLKSLNHTACKFHISLKNTLNETKIHHWKTPLEGTHLKNIYLLI